MSERFAPKTEGEMNCRRARQLKRELVEIAPQLTVEVWAIAQGLAYLRVEGPLTRGIVTLVLHTEGEVAQFKQLVRDAHPSPERVELYREVVRQARLVADE